MKLRFLADANLDQDIVAALLRREPQIDFELPQGVIPQGMPDPEVLELAASLARTLVTHDVRTMPRHFQHFIELQESPGLILVPEKLGIGQAIEDLLLIWQLSEAEEWVNWIQRLPL